MITRIAPYSVSPDVSLLILVEAGPAHDLREHPGAINSATPIFEAIRAAGHTVEPLHANAAGEPTELRSTFVVTAPACLEFERLAEHLRALPGVAATYLECDDARPATSSVSTIPVSIGAQHRALVRRVTHRGIGSLDARRLAG
ncbi:hypothetical protein [Mycobacteroides abscessus]|uniref:hypothetical protein n=1 Tax=Mycobacteroides abscessus TaxID=36809 RepID=UPI0009CE4073|nr:hypothetical protein [Mycobacteroides abscessus]SKQ02374.1 Uncharacterised protein [Mycobacteroides abscessus subsp. massiliense]